jgi:MarR family transcriptional regulator, organic hydroperoxide resistance regulator
VILRRAKRSPTNAVQLTNFAALPLPDSVALLCYLTVSSIILLFFKAEPDMDRAVTKDQDVIRRLTWEIASISVHLEEIRYFWAKALSVSGPQWMIIVALADLDQGEGVPVNAVSKMLHVDPSFVTTQSKLLEKKGFIRRKTSAEDARIVNMSLADKTYKQLADLASQQEKLNDFIFADFNLSELSKLTDKLAMLKKRLEKARLKVVADF